MSIKAVQQKEKTRKSKKLSFLPVYGIPSIKVGDDLASIIWEAIVTENKYKLQRGDILVVASKICAKSEGRFVSEKKVKENKSYQTEQGFFSWSNGIDKSNIFGKQCLLLPENPMESAHFLAKKLRERCNFTVPVIISDTYPVQLFGKEYISFAIGWAGIRKVRDWRGERDYSGKILNKTVISIVDELAAGADLLMGKDSGLPVVLIKGYLPSILKLEFPTLPPFPKFPGFPRLPWEKEEKEEKKKKKKKKEEKE